MHSTARIILRDDDGNLKSDVTFAGDGDGHDSSYPSDPYSLVSPLANAIQSALQDDGQDILMVLCQTMSLLNDRRVFHGWGDDARLQVAIESLILAYSEVLEADEKYTDRIMGKS